MTVKPVPSWFCGADGGNQFIQKIVLGTCLSEYLVAWCPTIFYPSYRMSSVSRPGGISCPLTVPQNSFMLLKLVTSWDSRLADDKMLIDAPSTDARLVQIPGYGWQPTPRAWEFPSHAGIVALALDALGAGLSVPDGLRAAVSGSYLSSGR